MTYKILLCMNARIRNTRQKKTSVVNLNKLNNKFYP